jgi:diguanylate cyclase
MKLSFPRKSLIIIIYVTCFIIWLSFSPNQRFHSDLGINIISIAGYIITLYWILQTYRSLSNNHRYFWLFFAMGIFTLLISKTVPIYQFIFNDYTPHSPIEDSIRIIGYLFFFTGFVYQMKIMSNTVPMLRFLLNIIMVIIAVYCVSWFFLVNPILEKSIQITNTIFWLSSIYHVLNISLVFASVCLIFMTKDKTSLYLIALGFLLQVIGDFFHINHIRDFDKWLSLLWPISSLIMGLSSIYTKDHQWIPNNRLEKIEYKRHYFSFISAAILLGLTYYNQLQETNVLQKGMYITVALLLLQQVLTTIENKSTFTKMKQLVYSSLDFQHSKTKDHQDNEMTMLLRQMDNLAHYDPLTNLPNRNLFQKCVEKVIKKSKEEQSQFSILYLDLDRFKYVNDSLGHDSGDLLLKEVAIRLKEALDHTSTIARLGGDEFAIILEESNKELLRRIATQLLWKFEEPFTIKGHDLYITTSIGISVYPEGGKTINDLLKSADAAMYLAKEEGKNNYKFFNTQLNEKISKKVFIETRLRRALEEKSLSLYYQPQVDLRTDNIIGFEALIRWNDQELGMVSPVEFIPIAEETGLIEPIGHWVLKTACQQLKDWQQTGLTGLTMSVNVSIRQFQNPDFMEELKGILQETQLSPQCLKIEITESILQNMSKTRKVLEQLKQLGIEIAIDDFGTGYSSLSYLKNLPVSCLKIDKAFIDELSVDSISPIVKTIIDMGRNMNFTVIAEGVESVDHVSFLRNNNCFVGQGYLFSKPLPALEIEHLLDNKLMNIS